MWAAKEKKNDIEESMRLLASTELPPTNSNSVSPKVDIASASIYTGIFKMSVLVMLCMQNSGHALLTRYSQGLLKEQYSASEVVFVGEILKLIFSAYFVYRADDSDLNIGSGLRKLWWLLTHAQSIIILVVLYSIGNVMSYYALGKVEASVYTVLSQLKILSTAAFSIFLLNRQLNSTKWRALFLLIIGCILVASPTFNKAVDCSLEPSKADSLARVLHYITHSIFLIINIVYCVL
jgi:multidrug transporter EmrE-like cation transporter